MTRCRPANDILASTGQIFRAKACFHLLTSMKQGIMHLIFVLLGAIALSVKAQPSAVNFTSMTTGAYSEGGFGTNLGTSYASHCLPLALTTRNRAYTLLQMLVDRQPFHFLPPLRMLMLRRVSKVRGLLPLTIG